VWGRAYWLDEDRYRDQAVGIDEVHHLPRRRANAGSRRRS
jgi:hypothetical protein